VQTRSRAKRHVRLGKMELVSIRACLLHRSERKAEKSYWGAKRRGGCAGVGDMSMMYSRMTLDHVGTDAYYGHRRV
jgi:hypothetical protein